MVRTAVRSLLILLPSLTLASYCRCEYIAFRNLWRVGYARVSHGDITDTELQVRNAPDSVVDFMT